MSRRNPRGTIVSLLAGLRLGMGAFVLAYGAVCSSNTAESAPSAAGTPEEALVAYVTLNGGAWYFREPPDAIRPAAAVPAPREPRRLAAPDSVTDSAAEDGSRSCGAMPLSGSSRRARLCR